MVLVNGKCAANSTAGQLLLYSRLSPEWIHGVHVAPVGITAGFAIPSILSPKGGALFTMDSTKSEIYFFDDIKSAIYKRSLHGGNVTLITSEGVDHVSCMVFDSASGNLYYGTRPSLEPAGITVFRPENPDKRLLITRTVGGVHSLDFDPTARLLFYSSTTQLRQHSITRANLDGTNPTVLVSFFSFHPLTMALDVSARKVYWLDPFEYTLHRAAYDGEDSE
ncbi:hypothetical protein GCK32_015055, partial [Trichostrongylus colubriformis]